MGIYNNASPYSETELNEYYLDVMVNRTIPKLADDVIFSINETYKYRPDLLAYDLYNDADLWWVFAQRNPDDLKNPLLDFELGTKIFLPKLSTLQDVLGI